MNTIFETEDREERQDSEVTLGTGTLLAIFFGLVVVCGVFFGFGYSMGRHSSEVKAAVAQSADTPAVAETSASTTSRPKPSALEALPSPAQQDSPSSDETSPRAVVEQSGNAHSATNGYPARSVGGPSQREESPVKPSRPSPRLIAATSPVTAPRFSSTVAQPTKPLAQPGVAVQSMVQIAAVSHPEDAQALVAALKKRGYAVSVRSEPQDKLMHVQVGPFATHVDADTMRQKLLSDGYNAIIK